MLCLQGLRSRSTRLLVRTCADMWWIGLAAPMWAAPTPTLLWVHAQGTGMHRPLSSSPPDPVRACELDFVHTAFEECCDFALHQGGAGGACGRCAVLCGGGDACSSQSLHAGSPGDGGAGCSAGAERQPAAWQQTVTCKQLAISLLYFVFQMSFSRSPVSTVQLWMACAATQTGDC